MEIIYRSVPPQHIPIPNWVLGLLGLIVVSQGVILLATGYTRRQLSSPAMRAHFTAPPNGARVPRNPLLSGTVENISAGTEVWLVVETDPVYHPQTQLQLPTASGAFQESVVIGGRSNNDSGHEFPVHVLAVSKNVSNTFRGYLRDSDISKRWVGVPKPADSRVLPTLKVIRADSASI